MLASQSSSIIFFDGVCNFCNASVHFIIRHDRTGAFRFAPLQSNIGRQVLSRFPELQRVESIVLVEGGRCYIESSAVLRIAKQLDGFWKAIYVLKIVPRPLRDAVYRMIAKNRYRWFGKQEACMVPTKEIRERFLNDEHA
jgi:predicted DCC family thiol-disulfide oxidoreductase YuxK